MGRHDVFRGATVVDGTGAPGFRADVSVRDGRIAAIGPDADGTRVVDADGLVLAPGFIDMHAHSDLQLLAQPDHLAKVSQGVTLEVLGQDGLSYAPVDDATLDTLRGQLAGWNDDPPGFDWDWRDRRRVPGPARPRDRVQRRVPAAAGHDPDARGRLGRPRRPRSPNWTRMRGLVATGLAEGALGMSSGLTYTPGMYATTGELVALCEVVAAGGGYYSPHHRSYGAGALEAYAEMVDVSRRSGCPLHLAHATMNFPVNAGRAAELLALLDDAIAAGADITLDTYPYLPGATYLSALLPSWATEGGPAATLARLSDVDTRERIRADLEEHGSDGCHGVPVDWDTIEVNGVRLRRQRAPGGAQRRRVRPACRETARRAVLRRAGRRAAGHLLPHARGRRGQRAGDHAPPRAHRWQRRPARRRRGRTRARGARSPATSATTCASSACSASRSASRT